MQASDELLDELIRQVRATGKYSMVSETLVRKIAIAELPKWKTAKEIVKSTRNKIHQVGSAFQETAIPYKNWEKELIELPQSIKSSEAEAFIRHCCQLHSSTAERLPFISTFFTQTLAPIQPVESILDLACGFTPLCIPWMPVTAHVSYTGIDIYEDMISFLDAFFIRYKINHCFTSEDIIDFVPREKAHVAFLLKTIPCLEQVDKAIGTKMLEKIPSDNILVSFPSRSLGGKSKGMAANYEAHFYQLISGKKWRVTKTEFPNEIAFLIQK